MNEDRVRQLLRARRIIEHSLQCARRAGVARFQLAASRSVDGFARAYDTLVLELTPHPNPSRLPLSVDDPMAIPATHDLREALLLLHALNNCRGFSLHENPEFWSNSLSLVLSPDVPIASHRFPRVALDWCPRDVARLVGYDQTASQRELEDYVLALFTTSPPLPPLSTLGQTLLADAAGFAHPRASSPIECVVVLRFASLVAATKALVRTVISAANTSTGRDTSPIVWVGVRLIESTDAKYTHQGLVSVTNLAVLARLCASLPPKLTVAFQLPESRLRPRTIPTDSLKRTLVKFLTPAIGKSATEWLGHMAVLDLTYRTQYMATPVPALDFAVLGTLLPFARSLEKLCVAVATTNDLVWLLYAVVHPLTRASKWRALYLDGQLYEPATWEVVHGLWQPPSLQASLWTLLTQPEDTIATRDLRDGSGINGVVRRTARIVSDAAVLSPDKSSTLVQIKVGSDVELCDTTTAIDELIIQYGNSDLDDLAVVVPGVGIGWMHKCHLSGFTDTSYDGRPESSLTTLSLGKNVATVSDLGTILQIFGPALNHLRSLHSEPFAVRELARLCPQLASLELPLLLSHGHDVDAAMWDLPHLSDVAMMSDMASLDACFRMLHRLPALRSVRLLVQCSHTSYGCIDWDGVDHHVATLLVAKKRTLRRFVLISPFHRPRSTAPRLDQRMFFSSTAKVAFLSVLQAARGAANGLRHEDALASLGADLVQLVFDFAGPSLMATAVLRSQLWPHSWYGGPCPRPIW